MGADIGILAIGSSKGLSLSIFILSILFSSVLLYNVIDRLGGIEIIGRTMTRLVGGPLAQALVVGWAFSGFMQGVAGFGVPVAVVTPLLVFMGFRPVKAAAIVLVGHAWAVSFGSLGSSFYTLTLMTGIPTDEIGPHKALLLALPTLLSGLAVAHIQGGTSAIRKGAIAIFVMSFAMACSTWLMSYFGIPQVASIASGLLGCTVGWVIIRVGLLRDSAERDTLSTTQTNSAKYPRYQFHLMFLPYYLVVLLSFLSQVPAVKELGTTWYLGLNYPETETALGFVTAEQEGYARIKLFGHPAPLILTALLISYLTYRAMGLWVAGTAISAFRQTYKQSMPSGVGVATMIMMAIVMSDVGMTTLLGKAIGQSTSVIFPILSPFMGMLGTFLTGSNTSSNIMFGALQTEIASSLGIDMVTIAATQSISGGISSAIAPAKVLVGTTVVGLSGRENEVLRKTVPYCIAITIMLGLQAWIFVHVF